jgi:D-lactate dehydrogenase (cytochrome)
MPEPDAAARAIAALKPLLGDRLATSHAVREHHSKDMSYLPASMPDAVAFPQTESEVQAIVRACAEHRVAGGAVRRGLPTAA